MAQREPSPGFVEELRAFIGRTGAPTPARDPVNAPMIRHWCDAMGDFNPVYIDPEFATSSCHGGLVAPPAMLNAWGMPGLVPRRASAEPDPAGQVYERLDAAGFTSVVATNCEHEYERYLSPPERLTATGSLEEVSDSKQTALGTGHFVTTLTEYHDPNGERVGSMRFRILKFAPGTGRTPPTATAESGTQRPRRPMPGISRDTRFFWDGVQAGELRIQECTDCSRLHHPPVVRCPGCGSYELGHRVASGRATLYSFVEPCHPRFPAFDDPWVVGLVELEEGTRLLTNLVDIDPGQVEIGMLLELDCRPINSEISLPLFRPRPPQRREQTLPFDGVQLGQSLAPLPLPITPTLIVTGAIASRDYQDVHHDRDLAVERGSPDIFMNILTTSGLCTRYVTDWAGPEAILKRLSIRLGAPNYPGDTMTLSGSVSSLSPHKAGGLATVSLRGANRLGDHVTGQVDVVLPALDAGRR